MSDTYLFKEDDLKAAAGNAAPFALAFYARGNDWAERGELDRAIADYDAAIRMNPLFKEALVNRGVVWARKGDLDRAIADYDAALLVSPRDGKAIRNRSLALEQKSNPIRDIECIKSGAAKRPSPSVKAVEAVEPQGRRR